MHTATTEIYTLSLHDALPIFNGEALINALGHAFFTLSIGMGAIMAYGAYLPEKSHIGKTVLIAATLDTVIALIAGVIIFSIVFSNGLPPTEIGRASCRERV